jgi:hypothetical protein
MPLKNSPRPGTGPDHLEHHSEGNQYYMETQAITPALFARLAALPCNYLMMS